MNTEKLTAYVLLLFFNPRNTRAQLCGRLPLCLAIVGKLILTFGQGWEEQVPSILRSDMGSLMQTSHDDGASGASGESQQPISMQQRVIQSV